MFIDYVKIVGERLQNFLLSKFESINIAAKYLGTTGNSLRNSYFNGKALPGGALLLKLLKLGCDVAWLLDDGNDNTALPEEPIYSSRQKILYVKELEKSFKELKAENIKLKKKVTDIEKFGIRITEYFERK